MAYSMTGFGKGSKIVPGRKCTVEIKSVNSRYCDIQIRLPRILNGIENRIRNKISSVINRGKVDVYISYEDTQNKYKQVEVDESLVKSYKDAIEEVAALLGKKGKIDPVEICGYDDVLKIRTESFDEDYLWDFVLEALEQALVDINSMRESEGDELVKDIKEKLECFLNLHKDIVERAPFVVRDFALKFKKRVEELEKDLEETNIDQQRMATEVALYADKCCIDEETVRLGSHLRQMMKTLDKEGPIGKKMDFIIQEINRETNTIGSKANDLAITECVLEMKSVTEKIREQIQNLE